MATVDRRVTNRNVVICGPAAPLVPGNERTQYPLQNPKKPRSKHVKYPDYYHVGAADRSSAPDGAVTTDHLSEEDDMLTLPSTEDVIT